MRCGLFPLSDRRFYIAVVFVVGAVIMLMSTSVIAAEPVEASEEIASIPTYPFGLADQNPIFYTGRVYQGAQGRVYPYAMRDILSDEKSDAPYRILRLENEYVKLGIAPDLGGRIFQATDKTDDYDFFYRQHVVKPALIGMLGAWISGGVEWNIPHHHRPSTFMPVDWAIAENDDGSKTVFVGETELRHRMKWNVATKLYPGKSLVEAEVTVENRSPYIQSILSWANVSVHCNENYQVIFPPTVQFGTGHSKTAFSDWPIDGGVDISWWKNHTEVSRSVFAWDFDSDFLAGYDFGKDAGTVHVGNVHVVAGKKFFLWGNHERARVWDNALTDDDGSYLELMVGGWSDNQPDYSWIGPGETRRYKHYWFPISKIRHVKNANLNGAINLEKVNASEVFVGYCPTEKRDGVAATLFVDSKPVWSKTFDVAPGAPFVENVKLDQSLDKEPLAVVVTDSSGHELISYRTVVLEPKEKPEPVAPFGKPEDYKTVEELYLAGVRLEQFHNGQRDPMEFYNEALKRDPGDARVNTAVGIRLLRDGKWSEGAERLQKALERLERNYTRVRDGEPHYYLGLALRRMGREKEAEDQFWRASWTTGYQSAAFYQLAELAARRGSQLEALELIERSLTVNADNPKALTFKAWAIRRVLAARQKDLGALSNYVAGNRVFQTDELARERAVEILDDVLKRNPLDYAAALEKSFVLNEDVAATFAAIEDGRGVLDSRLDSAVIRQQELLETVSDYLNRGAFDDARALLEAAIAYGEPFSNVSTIRYYLGWTILQETGDESAAIERFKEASKLSNAYVFPFRPEELAMYAAIVNLCKDDAQALYEYGDLLYFLNEPKRAEERWRESTQARPEFGRAWRNLGFAAGQEKRYDEALAYYRQALKDDGSDPRFIYEEDQLAAKAGVAASERIATLRKYRPAVFMYDDCVARYVELCNETGDFDEAIDVLANRHFHVWEGGRDVHSLFVDARLLRGIKRLDAKDYDGALKDCQTAADWPANFEAAPPLGGGQNAKIAFLTGLVYEKQGNAREASQSFEKCVDPKNAPNTVRSEQTFYRVLALRKLGRDEDASRLEENFRKAVADAAAKTPAIDEFSKFGEEGTSAERAAEVYFQKGLVAKLANDADGAASAFDAALKLNPNLIWAATLRDLL